MDKTHKRHRAYMICTCCGRMDYCKPDRCFCIDCMDERYNKLIRRFGLVVLVGMALAALFPLALALMGQI